MGRFVVFEGLDGSGKSTQAGRLHGHLLGRGERSLLTFEPTDGLIGSLARRATAGEVFFEDGTLALLFAADRREHYAKKIAPALLGGGTVVCDRYYYSNLAYQGICDRSIERIMQYNSDAMQAPPSVVFFLDVKPAECARRIAASRHGAGVYENLETLEALHERYMKVFSMLGSRESVVFIDAAGKSEDEVFGEILAGL